MDAKVRIRGHIKRRYKLVWERRATQDRLAKNGYSLVYAKPMKSISYLDSEVKLKNFDIVRVVMDDGSSELGIYYGSCIHMCSRPKGVGGGQTIPEREKKPVRIHKHKKPRRREGIRR